jgi:transposase-like protein
MKQKAFLGRKIEVPEWKRQSMALRMAMKQMRGGKVSEEDIKEVKQIQKMEQKSMFKCKFCGKRFNDEAGLRHQKFCETKSKDMRNRTKAR